MAFADNYSVYGSTGTYSIIADSTVQSGNILRVDGGTSIVATDAYENFYPQRGDRIQTHLKYPSGGEIHFNFCMNTAYSRSGVESESPSGWHLFLGETTDSSGNVVERSELELIEANGVAYENIGSFSSSYYDTWIRATIYFDIEPYSTGDRLRVDLEEYDSANDVYTDILTLEVPEADFVEYNKLGLSIESGSEPIDIERIDIDRRVDVPVFETVEPVEPQPS